MQYDAIYNGITYTKRSSILVMHVPPGCGIIVGPIFGFLASSIPNLGYISMLGAADEDVDFWFKLVKIVDGQEVIVEIMSCAVQDKLYMYAVRIFDEIVAEVKLEEIVILCSKIFVV